MSIDNVIEASPAGHDQACRRRRQHVLRWAMFRLVALWVPIAAVLALALWNALFRTLAPWNHHWNQGDANPPELDALPSQLLFAMLLVLAGRFETARRRGTDASSTSVRVARVYWTLSALLIGLGVVALWFMAISQPVRQ